MASQLAAELSATALRHNLALLRQRLAPCTRLCVAAKADAYGHGLGLLLDILAEETDALGVATAEEAVAARHQGFRKPILMFFSAGACGEGAEGRDALAQLIANRVWLTIVSLPEARLVAEAARLVRQRAEVHVKLDTGMCRSGLPAEDAPALVEALGSEPHLRLAGLYTHFATAEAADKGYTLEQLARFQRACAECRARSAAFGAILHAANSAAAIDLPQSHLGMVRPGIAAYGYQPSDEMHVRLALRPILRLTARLMQVRSVPAGSRCGYGLHHTFTRPSRIGLVPIGYADGYLRALTNKAAMRIRGQLVPTCGTISMDQTIVDLTDVPAASVGDEVEVISPNPSDPHSVEGLARLAGTIPYEITCRLGARVRRRRVNSFGGKADEPEQATPGC